MKITSIKPAVKHSEDYKANSVHYFLKKLEILYNRLILYSSLALICSVV